jgi:hypothetical protein
LVVATVAAAAGSIGISSIVPPFRSTSSESGLAVPTAGCETLLPIDAAIGFGWPNVAISTDLFIKAIAGSVPIGENAGIGIRGTGKAAGGMAI